MEPDPRVTTRGLTVCAEGADEAFGDALRAFGDTSSAPCACRVIPSMNRSNWSMNWSLYGSISAIALSQDSRSPVFALSLADFAASKATTTRSSTG